MQDSEVEKSYLLTFSPKLWWPGTLPEIEEKAAKLLYFVTKNHSFVDGNKRFAAACFIYFLKKNNALYNASGNTVISNEALASLILFIATSKTEEAEVVKRLVISILNQNKP